MNARSVRIARTAATLFKDGRSVSHPTDRPQGPHVDARARAALLGAQHRTGRKGDRPRPPQSRGNSNPRLRHEGNKKARQPTTETSPGCVRVRACAPVSPRFRSALLRSGGGCVDRHESAGMRSQRPKLRPPSPRMGAPIRGGSAVAHTRACTRAQKRRAHARGCTRAPRRAAGFRVRAAARREAPPRIAHRIAGHRQREGSGG